MKPTVEVQRILEKITAYLRVQPNLIAAFVFGSAITSSFNSHSDTDIAILTKKTIEPMDLIELREEASAVCGRTVDLIPITPSLSLILQNEIAQKGQLLFTHDEAQSLQFQIKAPQMFYDLMVTRASLEQSYIERKLK